MLVFGVKYRLGLIDERWKPELMSVFGNELKKHNCEPVALGGYRDHVHLLFSTKGTESLSDITKCLKTDSTNWINKKRLTLGKFAWQEGSGRFSYSNSQLPTVIRYVENQVEHHRVRTFREEMDALMRSLGYEPDDFDLPEDPE